jgi:hypothetical protein
MPMPSLLSKYFGIQEEPENLVEYGNYEVPEIVSSILEEPTPEPKKKEYKIVYGNCDNEEYFVSVGLQCYKLSEFYYGGKLWYKLEDLTGVKLESPAIMWDDQPYTREMYLEDLKKIKNESAFQARIEAKENGFNFHYIFTIKCRNGEEIVVDEFALIKLTDEELKNKADDYRFENDAVSVETSDPLPL